MYKRQTIPNRSVRRTQHNQKKKEKSVRRTQDNKRRKKNQGEEYNKDNFKKEEGRNSVKKTSENHIMYKMNNSEEEISEERRKERRRKITRPNTRIREED